MTAPDLSDFVVEVFSFTGDRIGGFERRYEYHAIDAKAALLENPPAVGEVVVIFQGLIGRRGRRPVAFAGGWTVSEWQAILARYGSVEGVKAHLGGLREAELAAMRIRSVETERARIEREVGGDPDKQID